MNSGKWLLFVYGYFMMVTLFPLTAMVLLKFIMCWKEIVVGPATAVLVIIYCYHCAPNYKKPCVTAGFLVGVLLSLTNPYLQVYPECHPLAYGEQFQTYKPLVMTVLAGFVTSVIILATPRKKPSAKTG